MRMLSAGLRAAASLWVLLATGCNLPAAIGATSTPVPPTATETPLPTSTHTATSTSTLTPTATFTASPSPTASNTATPSNTPTPSMTPSPSVTPTPEPLTLTATGSANCRYGPSKAYLYAWGMQEGDGAVVRGKNANGTWLWVQPDNTNWSCWVSTTAVEVEGDLETVKIVYPQVLTHPEVGAPQGVKANRSGSQVTINWDAAPAAVGLGYLIEARICIDGLYLWDVYYSTTNTSYTLKDPTSCAGDSYGQLRVYNKLGYSKAVKIPWP